MSQKSLKGYRGYYVNLEEAIALLCQLLQDSKNRKHNLVVVGNEEKSKIEGAIMSIVAIGEALIRMRLFGDLILQPPPPPPTAKGKPDVNTILGENGTPIFKEEE